MESSKWSELPPDLLSLILLNLAVTDHLRFASVCTSWASAASELRRRRRSRRPQIQQSPWLMFLDPSDPGAAKFYSVSEKKVYTIPHLPEPQMGRRLFLGSAHGWVVTVDERYEPLLLNPITRAQITLPSITTLPFITTLPGVEPVLRPITYESVILSGPPDSGECITVLTTYDSQVAFGRPSDERWTVLDEGVKNVAFHAGLLYSVTLAGAVRAYDLRDPSPKPITVADGPFPESFMYLVSAPWGDLLTVCRDRDFFDDDYFRTIRVRLFRVDIRSRRLVEMKNLVGDYSIFVGGNAAVCLSTKDDPGLRANCIYFTEEYMECTLFHRDHHRDIGIYSLEDGSVEPILRSDTRLYWPPPIWLMPNIF